MEAINQLKSLRDEALERLQANPDYKLLTSLDELIVDLESFNKTSRPTFKVVDDESDSEVEADQTKDAVEEAFEQITAELESENLGSENSEAEEGSRPFASFN
ncbi:MAG: hypothetical protein AAGA53_12120 [Pseudomonadota bacterium]